MNHQELDQVAEKIWAKVKNVPGLDKNFINQCLQGVSSLNDPAVEAKIKQLVKYL